MTLRLKYILILTTIMSTRATCVYCPTRGINRGKYCGLPVLPGNKYCRGCINRKPVARDTEDAPAFRPTVINEIVNRQPLSPQFHNYWAEYEKEARREQTIPQDIPQDMDVDLFPGLAPLRAQIKQKEQTMVPVQTTTQPFILPRIMPLGGTTPTIRRDAEGVPLPVVKIPTMYQTNS